MTKQARKQSGPKVGYFIQSRGPGDRIAFEKVYVYGPTRRSDEGIVGHDLRMRPTRLGLGDYTFVASPDDVEWTRPGESKQPKKSHAQIKREIDEVLARKPCQERDPGEPTPTNVSSIEFTMPFVSIYLDGVVGVSPVIGEYGWKQIQPDKADAYLRKGRDALDELVSQKAPSSAKGWLTHKVSELRGLLEKAQAVRDGATPQKMTVGDYAELRRSLGLR
jgi:hypothetical protein